MKKICMIFLGIVIVIYALNCLGYLSDAIGAILSNIPILGEVLLIVDTYNFFTFLHNDSFSSFDSVYIVATYIVSLLATVKTMHIVGKLEPFEKFSVGVVVYFICTLVFKYFFYEYIGLIENMGNRVETLMNELLNAL